MSLKSRVNRLSRGHAQIFLFNALPPCRGDSGDLRPPMPGVATLPEIPRLEGESDEAWRSWVMSIGKRMFPTARVIKYPQMRYPA